MTLSLKKVSILEICHFKSWRMIPDREGNWKEKVSWKSKNYKLKEFGDQEIFDSDIIKAWPFLVNQGGWDLSRHCIPRKHWPKCSRMEVGLEYHLKKSIKTISVSWKIIFILSYSASNFKRKHKGINVLKTWSTI
jgi:hypothetical protein